MTTPPAAGSTPCTGTGKLPKVGTIAGAGPAGANTATNSSSDNSGFVLKVTANCSGSYSIMADAGRFIVLMAGRGMLTTAVMAAGPSATNVTTAPRKSIKITDADTPNHRTPS